MENEKKTEEAQVEKPKVEEGKVENPQEEETVTLKKSDVDSMIKAAEDAVKIAESKTKAAKDLTAGIDKYKHQLKEAGISDEEEQPKLAKEDIAQMVKDAIKEALPEITKPKPEEDELTVANNKIAEMKLAFTNMRKTSLAGGSNVGRENDASKTEAEKFFSPEQIEEIKKKYPDADINQIYKNLPKGSDMSGAPK